MPRYSSIFFISVCRAGSISAKVYWSRFFPCVSRSSSSIAAELSTLNSGTVRAISGLNHVISSHSVPDSLMGLPPSFSIEAPVAGSTSGFPSISPLSVSHRLRRARKRSKRYSATFSNGLIRPIS